MILIYKKSYTFNYIHRILLISLVLAAKLYDDEYYENKYYAKIGGISNKDINKMELEFTEKIEFNLFVGEVEYELLKVRLIEFGMKDE